MELTRRDMLRLGLGTAAVSTLWPLPELFSQNPVNRKAIPFEL